MFLDNAMLWLIALAALWVQYETRRQWFKQWPHLRGVGIKMRWIASAGLVSGVGFGAVGLSFGWVPWLWRPLILGSLLLLGIGYRAEDSDRGGTAPKVERPARRA